MNQLEYKHWRERERDRMFTVTDHIKPPTETHTKKIQTNFKDATCTCINNY